jgi:hypothetical protein
MIITRNGKVVKLQSPNELEQGDMIQLTEQELMDQRLAGFASRGMYQITWASSGIKPGFVQVSAKNDEVVSCIANINGIYYITGGNLEEIKL